MTYSLTKSLTILSSLRWATRAKAFIVHILIIGGLLALWQEITHIPGLIDPLFVPSPKDIIQSFIELIQQADFAGDTYITVERVLLAFVLSILVALPLAFCIDGSRLWRKILVPPVDFLRYVPVPTLFPLTILFFGLDESAKIFILFFGTVFQLILLYTEDLTRIPGEYMDLFHTLRFSKGKIVWMKFTASLPEFYNNTRITLALCWSFVVIAELVSAEQGIGHMIKESQRFSDTPRIYVGILTMALIGFVSDYILRKLYFVFFPYKK